MSSRLLWLSVVWSVCLYCPLSVHGLVVFVSCFVGVGIYDACFFLAQQSRVCVWNVTCLAFQPF